MLRFSANLGFLWRDLPLLERIRRAAAAGFEAVEFHYPYDVPAQAVRTLLDETGLATVGLNAPRGDPAKGETGFAALPGREREARESFQTALAYARTIGCSYIHVLAGVAPPDDPQARTTYLAAFDSFAAAAAPHGLLVIVEPLNRRDAPGYFLNTSEQAAAIVAEVGRPNAKILFDCFHAQISEGDLMRRIERLLPVIGHIQIAAVPSRAEPDDGEVAYERLLAWIDALGYGGFIGAEYTPRESVEAGLGWLQRFRESRPGIVALPARAS